MLLQVTALGDEFEVRVGIAAIATNSSPSMEITLVSLGLALPHGPCFLYILVSLATLSRSQNIAHTYLFMVLLLEH
jgi:hypothetical protein